MDTTIISVLATGAGTAIAVVGLVSRSIGSLRGHMDQRLDALIHANRQAHDAIGLRIDNLRSELGARIDAQGAELGRRIETLEVRLARTSEDVAFIKGRIIAQADD